MTQPNLNLVPLEGLDVPLHVLLLASTLNQLIKDKYRIPEGLTNYADDTAAAAGGLAIGDLYRTGSAIKVRVA